MIYGIMLLMIGLKLKMSAVYYLLLGVAATLEVCESVCKSCCEKQVNLVYERRHHEV